MTPYINGVMHKHPNLRVRSWIYNHFHEPPSRKVSFCWGSIGWWVLEFLFKSWDGEFCSFLFAMWVVWTSKESGKVGCWCTSWLEFIKLFQKEYLSYISPESYTLEKEAPKTKVSKFGLSFLQNFQVKHVKLLRLELKHTTLPTKKPQDKLTTQGNQKDIR